MLISAFESKHKQAVQVNELLKFISESGNFDQPQDEHPCLNLLDNSYEYSGTTFRYDGT